PGEKRPVVVCQHGSAGHSEDVTDRRIKSVYHAFGAQLADRGYIVYAPQNVTTNKDDFRQVHRRAHTLKASLFSLIVGQNQRLLEWLKSLPQVDPDRIAFYGLSYGGKTAMRVPAILKGYCLSICSGDFNEYAWKTTGLEKATCFMFHQSYEIYEFD